MKFIPFSILLLAPESRGQETTPTWNVEIPVPISDGQPAQPAPKPEPIDFTVLTSRTQRMKVTEAPEMLGLPPIKGTINVTVQMVEDPGLPDPPPPPLPALPPTDPAILARLAEARRNHQNTGLVFLSATVYDHSRTLLRIYPNGKVEGEISAWSNIDFNHFSGFSTYRIKEADGSFSDRDLLMGIDNTNTLRMRQRIAQRGHVCYVTEIPELPDLAVSSPSFVVIGGERQGEAMDTLAQIHELYRKEGVRMEAAYHAREKARAERYAYLLKNPPVPEDIVIRFWKRDVK